ncbi:hypothetical protein Pint_08237 [Pistacia integerrima]|uniref:Uncharacterized protein n=1 Tax=Pistacia integerrima TaxID=434235 RepID=A0ACC0XTM9_9ROSI|nr:hypothetical protein Pint_08237 [Pistacia integerrima]
MFNLRKRPYRTYLNLNRISRSGFQIYSNYQRFLRILDRVGIIILSISRGIMTNRSLTRKNWRRNFVLYMVIFLIPKLYLKLPNL